METKVYTFKTLPDGTKLQADVHYQIDVHVESASRPIALIFHGGGFSIGSRGGIPASQVQTLVEYGFIVVSPDYRLCPQISILNGPLKDGLDAYLWAKKCLPLLIDKDMKEAGKQSLTLDPKRTVVLGSSAGGTIALWLGSQPDPPSAIADFGGPKYLTDPFFSSPLAVMADTPSTSQEFQKKVYEGPQATFTSSSKPNFSDPRSAWLYGSMKEGTWLRDILKSHSIEEVDPTCGFSANFPPTVFVKGDQDFHAPLRFDERAYKELIDLGVESQLVEAKGQGHLFEYKLKVSSDIFTTNVLPAMEFLKARVF